MGKKDSLKDNLGIYGENFYSHASLATAINRAGHETLHTYFKDIKRGIGLLKPKDWTETKGKEFAKRLQSSLPINPHHPQEAYQFVQNEIIAEQHKVNHYKIQIKTCKEDIQYERTQKVSKAKLATLALSSGIIKSLKWAGMAASAIGFPLLFIFVISPPISWLPIAVTIGSCAAVYLTGSGVEYILNSKYATAVQENHLISKQIAALRERKAHFENQRSRTNTYITTLSTLHKYIKNKYKHADKPAEVARAKINKKSEKSKQRFKLLQIFGGSKSKAPMIITPQLEAPPASDNHIPPDNGLIF